MKNKTTLTLAAAIALVAGAGTIANAADDETTVDNQVPPSALVEKPVPAEKKLRAYIGVHITEVPEILAAHLDLAEGFGIMVEAVQDGSPAIDAGIRKYDVIVRFEDQILVNPQQFSTLVHGRKPGAKVTLMVIQKGKEQLISVTLAGRDADELAGGDMMLKPKRAGDAIPFLSKLPWLSQLRKGGGGSVHGWNSHGGGGGIGGDFPKPNEMKQFLDGLGLNAEGIGKILSDETTMKHIQTALEKMFAPEVEIDVEIKTEEAASGNESASSVSLSASSLSAVLVSDDDGAVVEIRGDQSGKNLKVTGKDGEVIFEGPYNTDGDKAKVPEDIREKIKVLDNITISSGDRK